MWSVGKVDGVGEIDVCIWFVVVIVVGCVDSSNSVDEVDKIDVLGETWKMWSFGKVDRVDRVGEVDACIWFGVHIVVGCEDTSPSVEELDKIDIVDLVGGVGGVGGVTILRWVNDLKVTNILRRLRCGLNNNQPTIQTF